MTPECEVELNRILGALHPEVTIEPDGADGGVVGTARFEPQPEHRGIRGLLHGGMAATVADHVCARAAGAVLGGRVVTGTLDLRYRQPVPLDGGPYRVEVRAGRARGRAVRVAGAVFSPSGRPLVEVRALFVAQPAAR